MGYIKIDRKIMDNSLWTDKPFSEGQAWIDMILLADYKTKNKKWRGQDTIFKRGDLNTSMQYLADRWGWTRSKTRAFIDRLVDRQMITIQTHNRKRTVITIVKYEEYQDTIKKGTDTDINWEKISE